jgi:serine/threonine-protein kinase
MEYVPGTDLKSLLQSQGRYTLEQALPLILQACAGLGYAHRAGLIHCDVKPHNMIVSPDARLKITDFGIARALSTIDPDKQASVIWGTPQYFSPEQASGKSLTPASDVYSLGVVMYEMLTGRLPFIGSTAEELSALHRSAPPPDPHQFNPDISPTMERIIQKVLSKEPSARYRTADHLGRVLMSTQQPGIIQTQVSELPVQHLLNTSLPTSTAPVPGVMIQQVRPTPNPSEDLHKPLSIGLDWITWALALLALIAVGGLIPLWLWVYLLYFPIKP